MEFLNRYDAQGKYVEIYHAPLKKPSATYLRSTGYAVSDVITLSL